MAQAKGDGALRKYYSWCVTIAIAMLLAVPSPQAYDDQIAHPAITVKSLTLYADQYFKSYLGFQTGMQAELALGTQLLTIQDWLKTGATAEDKEACRRAHHMHDPLKAWNQSYMTDDPFSYAVKNYCSPWARYSNVTWATGFLSPAPSGQIQTFSTDPAYAPYNWDRARANYYTALISSANGDREAYFAMTFRTLGHVLHLLQDMAVPAHTRNDFTSHLILDPVYGMIQPYENYVKIFPSLVITADPAGDFPTFSDASITKYWDTDQYNGTNPSASTSIGLSEYSNANFFSDTTIFKGQSDQLHAFPYPAWAGVQEYQEIIDGNTGKRRTYLGKVGYGENINHLAATKWFYKYLPTSMKNAGLQLDDKCHEDYARKLLPRAVGYSAGLLNYFFRGTLEVSAPERHAYAVTDGSQTPYVDPVHGTVHQRFTTIRARILNTTPNEVMNAGILQAVARYKIIPNYQPNLSAYPPDGIVMHDIAYFYSVSTPITLTSEQLASMNMYPTEFVFAFSTSAIPAGITDLTLQVIFKGTLGNEQDTAVAVGMKDLKEPTHHVFWNLSDMFSLYGHLYTAAQIRADPDLLNLAGSAFIDPYTMHFTFAYLPESPPPSAPVVVASVTDLPPGRYIRMIALVDDELTANYLRLVYTNPVDSDSGTYDFVFDGVVNQERDGTWQTPTATDDLRGSIGHLDQGVLRCKPYSIDPATGWHVCAYPEAEAIPANLTPHPMVITP